MSKDFKIGDVVNVKSRPLDKNDKSWWQRGYADGFEGVEPTPPKNDISWSDYMHGYKAGKAKAGW